MKTIDDYFDAVIEFGLDNEPMNPVELMVKATEEFGELSEQVLYHNTKYLNHKQLDEYIEDELGDVLNCVLVSVAKTMRRCGVPREQVKEMMRNGMMRKLEKYKQIVENM